MEYLCLFLSDVVVFWLLQGALLVLVLYAWWKELVANNRRREAFAVVKRGEESWAWFPLAYGIASAVILQLINGAEAGKNYKVIISLADMVALLYLSFFNGWFRNKIIQFVVASKEKKEKF